MACELLVKRSDNPGEDGVAWKAGDVVVVMPAGHRWGRKEDPATSSLFYVVEVPDLEVEEARELLLEQELDERDPEQPQLVRLRTRRLELARLDANYRGPLESHGRQALPWRRVRQAFRNMSTRQYDLERHEPRGGQGRGD